MLYILPGFGDVIVWTASSRCIVIFPCLFVFGYHFNNLRLVFFKLVIETLVHEHHIYIVLTPLPALLLLCPPHSWPLLYYLLPLIAILSGFLSLS